MYKGIYIYLETSYGSRGAETTFNCIFALAPRRSELSLDHKNRSISSTLNGALHETKFLWTELTRFIISISHVSRCEFI